MKVFGFFIFIYGWFSLYDAGLTLDGLLCFLLGFTIIAWQDIQPIILRKLKAYDE